MYTLLIRLKNTSETLSMEARLAVIDEFTEQVLAATTAGIRPRR